VPHLRMWRPVPSLLILLLLLLLLIFIRKGSLNSCHGIRTAYLKISSYSLIPSMSNNCRKQIRAMSYLCKKRTFAKSQQGASCCCRDICIPHQ
jgi:hypothetical protein